ncbi:elongation factor G [candidate division KSB1 bacterium]|nr:elongation factor G [candidate division KSB1 bacterium]
MKEFESKDIRNIGLVSHQSTGKTTLAEGILFAVGETNRFGKIEDGTTISDYRTDEIERKISISTSLLHIEYENKKINVIDMPGYADFVGEVRCGLRVTDLAVLLLSATAGVEVGTDITWDILNEFEIPRIFFINLVDREHADFDRVYSEAKEAFGNGVIAFQFPVGSGEGFHSIIDILRMKKLNFSSDGSGQFTQEDIPSDLAAKAEEMRTEMIEKIAECDDDILEKFFETETLSEEDIVKGLKAGLISRTIFPVFCGAAAKNYGVKPLLDFVVNNGTLPTDRTFLATTKDGKEITVTTNTSAEFSGLAFKTLSELHVGELSLIRVMSGSIKSGDEVFNSSKGVSEKIGQIYALNGKNRKEIAHLKAGDIGALVKLKDTHTGNTLTNKKNPLKYKPIQFPEAVVQMAVVPKSKGDEDKISSGLHTLHEIDPSFYVKVDPELKQTVISGQGDLHLAIIIQRLKERYNVEVEQKKPKIPYRETITAKADEKYRHKKQTGGAGQFAEVWMRIEPLQRGTGFEFASAVVGGNISSVFIPSIEKGIMQIMAEGPVAGYKVVDVKAIVYDGKEHPVDSKDIAFQIAGREVFKTAFLNARPILLEPIYEIEVKCPENYMGDVLGDLSSRRGRILGTEASGRFLLVKALAPLAELHNYATTLRSITQGRATYTRKLSHYDPVPKEIEAKVIEESKAEKERH